MRSLPEHVDIFQPCFVGLGETRKQIFVKEHGVVRVWRYGKPVYFEG